MFSGLREDSLFYILSEKEHPKLEIGKVVEVTARPKVGGNQQGYIYGQKMETVIDVKVKVDDGEPYLFKDLPATLSRVIYPESGLIVSDNEESLIPDVEAWEKRSRGIVESAPYHEKALKDLDEIKMRLSPKLKEERQRDERIDVLERKLGEMEENLGGDMKDLKSMMLKMLNGGSNKKTE